MISMTTLSTSSWRLTDITLLRGIRRARDVFSLSPRSREFSTTTAITAWWLVERSSDLLRLALATPTLVKITMLLTTLKVWSSTPSRACHMAKPPTTSATTPLKLSSSHLTLPLMFSRRFIFQHGLLRLKFSSKISLISLLHFTLTASSTNSSPLFPTWPPLRV